jgi:hypothetical protein
MHRADSGGSALPFWQVSAGCRAGEPEARIAGQLQAEAVALSAIFPIDYVVDERTPRGGIGLMSGRPTRNALDCCAQRQNR